MARFNGKKVLSTKVSDGIKIPEELIGRIEKGDAPVYHHEGGAASSSLSSANESFGRKIYKHLMNGVSNMLPFTVAGGIFIALAFLIDKMCIRDRYSTGAARWQVLNPTLSEASTQ